MHFFPWAPEIPHKWDSRVWFQSVPPPVKANSNLDYLIYNFKEKYLIRGLRSICWLFR